MLQVTGRKTRLALITVTAVAVLYGVLAYLLLPMTWKHYEHQKGLTGLPMVTRNGEGIPGDPINVGAVGSKDDLVCAMHEAQWYPADPITLRSSIAIVGSVLLNRPYRDAPVSHLYYEGRSEDLAFQKPAGKSADRRHHVRFWHTLDRGEEGRAVWLGAVTFDRGVGFSHRDAKITHHIGPDIDAERDLLIADLTAAKVVTSIYDVTGIGPTLNGRNAGGDRYYTDGEIKIAVLVEGCGQKAATTVVAAEPPLVELKNLAWSAVGKILLPEPSEPVEP
jgi:LssY C-terminus